MTPPALARSDAARRTLLVLAGMVFLAVAVGALIDPHALAGAVGYELTSVDAMSEFRAVYTGAWAVVAMLMLIAAHRIRESVLGDLAGLIVLGMAVGRVLSLMLDGVPGGATWPFFAAELVGGLALLLIRPERDTATPRIDALAERPTTLDSERPEPDSDGTTPEPGPPPYDAP